MFRTRIDYKDIICSSNLIDYQSNILMIGSCFVQHIGEKLDYYKFKTTINPYGILFQPLAIEQLFQDVLNDRCYILDDLIRHQELWHSLNHHSDWSHPDKGDMLKRINDNVKTLKNNLVDTTHIVLTLGTAWAYYHKKHKQLVANCHKLPACQFSKYLLTHVELEQSLKHTLQLIKKLSPQSKVIITLSPVRHLREGMVDNMHSKARLLSVIHQVVDNEMTYYFPAYEIMMDDLRDYRFYTDDFLHPNSLAIDYIWDVFKTVWLDKQTEPCMTLVSKYQKGLRHKPNFPETDNHKKFVVCQKELKDKINRQFGVKV